MTYKDEIKKAMKILAKDNKVIFLGQGVNYGGNIYGTLNDIDEDKKIELPIMEEVQMGMAIGLSLEGYIPVCIYPRFDFLILAINQLINHLDKIEDMSKGEFKPKVIIRVLIGTTNPLDPGPQHRQDHTRMIKEGITNINLVKLNDADQIVKCYKDALNSDKSTILIEERKFYDQ